MSLNYYYTISYDSSRHLSESHDVPKPEVQLSKKWALLGLSGRAGRGGPVRSAVGFRCRQILEDTVDHEAPA